MNKYTQRDFLNIIMAYNSIDRQTVKKNLKIIKVKYSFSNSNIIADLGHKVEKVRGWFNMTNNTIPIFEDALGLAVYYGFDITEMLQDI